MVWRVFTTRGGIQTNRLFGIHRVVCPIVGGSRLLQTMARSAHLVGCGEAVVGERAP